MEPSPHPPYSGDQATCPKCGGQMDSKYMPAGTVFVSASGGCVYRYGQGPEWMWRECFDCGFGWPELCGDSEAAIGDILGALPPEPPIGTVLATSAVTGEWREAVDRRADGWHLSDWSGGDPMTWSHVFSSFRPLRVERISNHARG